MSPSTYKSQSDAEDYGDQSNASPERAPVVQEEAKRQIENKPEDTQLFLTEGKPGDEAAKQEVDEQAVVPVYK